MQTMKILLVQTGRTTWEEDSRIEPPAGAPLTEAGLRAAETIAAELAGEGIKTVYASLGEAEQQTAKVLAKQLRVKVHVDDDMGELDFGLWQGLTTDEIKHRQPKLYKQWNDDPTSTCPPGGETVQDAQDRLKSRVKNIVKKPKNTPAALILRPVSVGLLRCLFVGANIAQLWQYVDRTFTWTGYEIDPDKL